MTPADGKLLKSYQDNLKELFIVSDVQYAVYGSLKNGDVEVLSDNADGEKCPRCWHFAQLQELESFGRICPKCSEALS